MAASISRDEADAFAEQYIADASALILSGVEPDSPTIYDVMGPNAASERWLGQALTEKFLDAKAAHEAAPTNATELRYAALLALVMPRG